MASEQATSTDETSGDTPVAAEARLFPEKGLAGELAAIAEPVIEDLGFRLVRVIVSGRDGGTVQIMAENKEGSLRVAECEKISRELSPIFDLADAYPSAHRLEVSSPGVDRPLARKADFESWAGFEAKIEVIEAIDGRKRFRGKLDGFEDDEVRLEIEQDGSSDTVVIGLPIALITTAKLTESDELFKEALRQSAKNKNG